MARELGPDKELYEDITPSEDVQEELDLLEELEGEEGEDGSITFDFSGEEELEELSEDESDSFYENLVDYFEEDDLDMLGEEIIEGAENDRESNEEYYDQVAQGLSMLGLGIEELNTPFEGACSATHPVIIESAVKFQSKASSELFPANGPVKTQILGDATDERSAQAKRIKDHMNYQLTTQMDEYFPKLERMLYYLPLIGSAIKKLYFDEGRGRPYSEFIRVDKFYINQSCEDLKSSSRYTHVIEKTENELRKDFVNGLYKEPENWEWGGASDPKESALEDVEAEIMGYNKFTRTDFDGVYTLYEQHVDMYLEDDPMADPNELANPYIVTVDSDSGKVLSIRRNWKQGDLNREKRMWFVHYPFVPATGFFCLGYIHLLANFQATLTSIIRSLVDAGQFANLQGGFKARGLRVVGDNEPIAPGEWKDVEAAGLDLSKALLPLPYKEPSTVLFQTLQFLDARVQKFADTAEQVIADSTNYGPVGTTLALLDASQKFFSGIHKRLHFAQKQELQILAELNFEYLDEKYAYDVIGATKEVQQEDYNGRIDIIPVSDPNISSNSHRMALAQAKMQVAQMFPGDINRKEVIKDFFKAMGDESSIERFVPTQPQAKPQDPMSDITAAVKGMPIGAFPGQHHDAHIKAKQSWLQDPMGGGNQINQQAVPALMSNIRDHMLLRYQELMEAELRSQGKRADDEFAVAEAMNKITSFNHQEAENQGFSDPLAVAARAQLVEAEAKAKEVEYDKQQKQLEMIFKYAEMEMKNQNSARTEAGKLATEAAKIASDEYKHLVSEETKRESAKSKDTSGRPSPEKK